MPVIEELPLTAQTRITPGWALVPDTQPITAFQPGKRSRGTIRENGGVGGRTAAGISAKQQKAAEARLAKLEKENHQDTTIPIPAAVRSKERSKKMTTNVRRILTYQRNFGHYLADEMAQLQAGGGGVVAFAPAQKTDRRGRESTVTGSVEGSRRTSSQRLPMPPPPQPRSTSRTSQVPAAAKREASTVATPSPAPTPISTLLPIPTQAQPSDSSPINPLLKNLELPKPPSARVMSLLLAEPALTYTAAQAQPLDASEAKPPRHFCGNCGYWGKVQCRACGAGRTCGLLECYNAHREVCEGLLH